MGPQLQLLSQRLHRHQGLQVRPWPTTLLKEYSTALNCTPSSGLHILAHNSCCFLEVTPEPESANKTLLAAHQLSLTHIQQLQTAPHLLGSVFQPKNSAEDLWFPRALPILGTSETTLTPKTSEVIWIKHTPNPPENTPYWTWRLTGHQNPKSHRLEDQEETEAKGKQNPPKIKKIPNKQR